MPWKWGSQKDLCEKGNMIKDRILKNINMIHGQKEKHLQVTEKDKPQK